MTKPRRSGFRLTLRWRIYLGFFFIGGLLIILGSVSVWSVLAFNSYVDRFNRLNEQATMQIDIALTVSNLQRQVVRFINEGHESAAEDALFAMEKARQRIDQSLMADDVQNPVKGELEKISRHLELYNSAFVEVIGEKRIYKDLTSEKLPKTTEELSLEIQRFHRERGLAGIHREEQLYLAESRVSLLSYFESLDAREANKARKYVDKILQMIEDNHGDEDEGELPGTRRGRIRQLLDQYEKQSIRAIQATRSYLYFVNVVMAGEASEIVYHANRLRESGAAQKASIQMEITQLTEKITLLIVWITFLSILASIIYAIVTARQITEPVSQITNTLSDLADGLNVRFIPGTKRQDEIGKLAHAANVFRERNVETENLLIRADSLTRELQEKQEALEASNQEMEQFVYTVSHELKSPIVTSMGFIGIIRELASAGRYEEAIEKLDRVEKANIRMGQLINDLLDLGRVGRVDMEETIVNSAEVLESLRAVMEQSLKEAGFSMEVVGEFPRLKANASRFQQIFENLVSNALKYGRGEPPHGNRIRIHCETQDARNRHVFHVRDYGPGIPEEFREKVFALFARLDNTARGTGIGLTIVRKLARHFGGEAWITDLEDGPGAHFCVTFPIMADKTEPPQ